MNSNEMWTNVFGNNNPGGESAAVGLGTPAEPISVSHNAQSDWQHMHVAAEHAHMPDEPIAESKKLKRTTIYLDVQHLAQLAAVDEQPAAWHVRRAIAAYVERMTKPTEAHQHTTPDPLSVDLTPSAHSLAVHIAQRMGVDVGQLVSAAVLEQLEVMR